MARQGFADQAEAAHIQALPRHRTTVLRPSSLPKGGNQVATGRVHITVINASQVLPGPKVQLMRQHPVPVLKERPAQKCPVCHLSPLLFIFP
jgi:hypothetical protein